MSRAPGGGPDSRYMLGVLNWIEGKIPEAEKEWREAIRLRPEMAKAHYNLGILHRVKNDRVRSMSFLTDAVRLDNENPQYRYSLAVLQMEMGNKINGNSNLDRVRAQTDRPDLASLALAYQMLTNDKPGPAEKAAKKAIEENKELTDAYIVRGRALVRLGDDKEAKAMFEQALKLDMNIPEAKKVLAAIEEREKAQIDKAEKEQVEESQDNCDPLEQLEQLESESENN